MKATSMYICLEGLKFFARHGVAPQETVVGANFTIDLKLKTNFIHAAQTDRLEGTVSYADVHTAVKEVMKTPSRLLEHVCERIAERLFHDFNIYSSIKRKSAYGGGLSESRSRSTLRPIKYTLRHWNKIIIYSFCLYVY